jgi:hypothetical protein
MRDGRLIGVMNGSALVMGHRPAKGSVIRIERQNDAILKNTTAQSELKSRGSDCIFGAPAHYSSAPSDLNHVVPCIDLDAGFLLSVWNFSARCTTGLRTELASTEELVERRTCNTLDTSERKRRVCWRGVHVMKEFVLWSARSPLWHRHKF